MGKRFTLADLDNKSCNGTIRGIMFIPKSEIKGESIEESQQSMKRAVNKRLFSAALIKANHRSTAKDWIASTLPYWCESKGLMCIPEHKFHSKRKWRLDYAIIDPKNPSFKVAVEYEGIFRSEKSGHRTEQGYLSDCEKYNHAIMDGWLLLRYTANGYKVMYDHLETLYNKYYQ